MKYLNSKTICSFKGTEKFNFCSINSHVVKWTLLQKISSTEVSGTSILVYYETKANSGALNTK